MPSRTASRVKYGTLFPAESTDLTIEMAAIQAGGRWRNRPRGKWYGEGFLHHFKAMQTILWPEHHHHEWSDLLLENFINQRIIGVLGAASTGKTHSAALFALCCYYVWPNETTVICTSTEREALEDRVWGEIKKHHISARSRHEELPGYLIESRLRILTDQKDDEDGRDFRNGMVGVACKRGGSFVGVGGFSGRKNKRVILIADEGSFMPRAYLDAISNLNKNPWFRGIVLGNPKEPTDALGLVCEPASELGGWDGGIDQTGGTKHWKTRFLDGVAIQLVGSDSPNMKVPPGQPDPYPYLIKRKDIESDIAFYGRDSLQFTMMNEGRMPRGVGLRRVITRQLCERMRAMEDPVWKGTPRTTIAFLDAAYGAIGGDRCVYGTLSFGTGLDEAGHDRQLLALEKTALVPVSAKEPMLPEDQIATWVREQCEKETIPPANLFFDSTGRGALMGAFARIWSPYVNGVEFGGKPTERVVSNERRVPCCDYYFNFVTELWYSVRLIIEAGQFRGLTTEVMNEGCIREWKQVAANKIQIEPKEDTKKRMGRSPDLFDALVAGVEGARRRGFVISRLSNASMFEQDQTAWEDLAERFKALRRRGQLNYSAS